MSLSHKKDCTILRRAVLCFCIPYVSFPAFFLDLEDEPQYGRYDPRASYNYDFHTKHLPHSLFAFAYFIICPKSRSCYNLLWQTRSIPVLKDTSALSEVISLETPMGKYRVISPFSRVYFTPRSVSPVTLRE